MLGFRRYVMHRSFSCFSCGNNLASSTSQRRHAGTRQQQWLSSKPTKTPSPYVVLNLQTSATKDDIKTAFRRLAKQYHPDKNPDKPRNEAEAKMSEIIDAYNQLMDDDFGGRVGDSRVALACEMYTIDELRLDRLHDVYSIKIVYCDEGDDSDEGRQSPTANISSNQVDLSSKSLFEVFANPDDSVSDLKRQIQSRFMDQWGLNNRRLDRDGIATGWELMTETDRTVLSYHLFLHSYGIKNNDILHAVVRRHNEVEREASSF